MSAERRVLIRHRLGRKAFAGQLLLAALLGRPIGQIRLRGFQIGFLLVIARLQRGQIVAGMGQLRLGLFQRDPEGLVIQPEQDLPGLHRLVVLDLDLGDAGRDIGADLHHIRLGIGVIGPGVAPAGEIDVGPRQDCGEGHDEQEQEADEHPLQPAGLGGLGLRRLRAKGVELRGIEPRGLDPGRLGPGRLALCASCLTG